MARGDLRADVQGPRDVQLPLPVDELAELDPLEVLHHEEERAVGGGPRIGDVDDVGVRDLRGGARLTPEPLDEIGRLAVGRVQDLERHAPADVDVLGLEHPAHPPLADEAAHVVAAPDHAPHDRHGPRTRARVGGIRVAGARVAGRLLVGDGQPSVAQPPGLNGNREHRLALRALGLVVGFVGPPVGAVVGARGGPGVGLRVGLHFLADGLGLPGHGQWRRDGLLAAAAGVPLARLDDQLLALGPLGRDVLVVELGEKLRHPGGVHSGRGLRQKPGQIVAQLLAVHVAVLEVGRQRLQGDAIQLGRHAPGALGGRHQLRVPHPPQELLGGVLILGRARRASRREELPAGEQLPENDAGGVEIGAAVDLLAARLLGRHVADLAVDDSGRGLLDLQGGRGQPEVGQPNLAAVREQHVGRRDVPMHQLDVAEVVGVEEAARHLARQVGGDVDGKGDPLLGAAVPGGAQIAPLDVVHRQVDLAARLSRVEHRDQVPVREAHDHLGLVAEALQVLLVRQVRQDRLDDAELGAVLRARQRQVERAHPAAGQRLEEDVLPEPAREFVHFTSARRRKRRRS